MNRVHTDSPDAFDSYDASRLVTIVGPVVPVVLWVIAAMQLAAAPLYWFGVTPTQSRANALILILLAASCVVIGERIRAAARRIHVAAAGAWSILAIALLATGFSTAAYLADLGVGMALPYCVLLTIGATPFWLRLRHYLLGLVGGFVPPFAVAFATQPSAVEWSFSLQITGATIIASLGIFLLMRRTAMRAHLLSIELAHRAAYDGLTGALNRTTWTERAAARLADEQRHGQTTACLFVDVDDFKQINDIHGHEVGDACLGRVADALRVVAVDHRLVGRLGGDEFVVLLPHTGDEEARALAERIHMTLRSRAADIAAVSVSIGVATDVVGETLAGLVHRADLAMLEVKARRKGTGAPMLGVSSISPAAVASAG